MKRLMRVVVICLSKTQIIEGMAGIIRFFDRFQVVELKGHAQGATCLISRRFVHLRVVVHQRVVPQDKAQKNGKGVLTIGVSVSVGWERIKGLDN